MNNFIGDMKIFILRALARMQGIPMPGAQLRQSLKDVLMPTPLDSEISGALGDLERDGFISGVRDDFDSTKVTWTLTTKGQHKASQLQ